MIHLGISWYSCPIGTMNKCVATQTVKGMVIKASDPLELKVWVTPLGKSPKPAMVIAEDMGKEFRVESGTGREGRLVVALRSIAVMRVVSIH